MKRRQATPYVVRTTATSLVIEGARSVVTALDAAGIPMVFSAHAVAVPVQYRALALDALERGGVDYRTVSYHRPGLW